MSRNPSNNEIQNGSLRYKKPSKIEALKTDPAGYTVFTNMTPNDVKLRRSRYNFKQRPSPLYHSESRKKNKKESKRPKPMTKPRKVLNLPGAETPRKYSRHEEGANELPVDRKAQKEYGIGPFRMARLRGQISNSGIENKRNEGDQPMSDEYGKMGPSSSPEKIHDKRLKSASGFNARGKLQLRMDDDSEPNSRFCEEEFKDLGVNSKGRHSRFNSSHFSRVRQNDSVSNTAHFNRAYSRNGEERNQRNDEKKAEKRRVNKTVQNGPDGYRDEEWRAALGSSHHEGGLTAAKMGYFKKKNNFLFDRYKLKDELDITKSNLDDMASRNEQDSRDQCGRMARYGCGTNLKTKKHKIKKPPIKPVKPTYVNALNSKLKTNLNTRKKSSGPSNRFLKNLSNPRSSYYNKVGRLNLQPDSQPKFMSEQKLGPKREIIDEFSSVKKSNSPSPIRDISSKGGSFLGTGSFGRGILGNRGGGSHRGIRGGLLQKNQNSRWSGRQSHGIDGKRGLFDFGVSNKVLSSYDRRTANPLTRKKHKFTKSHKWL